MDVNILDPKIDDKVVEWVLSLDRSMLMVRSIQSRLNNDFADKMKSKEETLAEMDTVAETMDMVAVRVDTIADGSMRDNSVDFAEAGEDMAIRNELESKNSSRWVITEPNFVEKLV